MSPYLPGTYTMTGYLYDADGVRVAKGSITAMGCDPTANGFQLTENYVLGLGGEELSMLDGNNNWQRTGQRPGSQLRMALLIADTLLIAGLPQRQAAMPAVRMHGAAWLDAVLDERYQSGCGSTRNVSDPADPWASFLGRHCNQ